MGLARLERPHSGTSLGGGRVLPVRRRTFGVGADGPGGLGSGCAALGGAGGGGRSIVLLGDGGGGTV